VAAAAYTSLAVQTSLHPFNSDHVPFCQRRDPGRPHDRGRRRANDSIHTGDDTRERLDLNLAVETVRMNVATAASALGRAHDEEPA
jgi:hypothetical protein